MSSPDRLTTTTPSPPRRPTRVARPAGRSHDEQLARAVTATLHAFGEIERSGGTDRYTRRRRVEQMLRAVIDHHHGAPHPATPAVTVACAHLAADAVEDAYFALLTARDLLR